MPKQKHPIDNGVEKFLFKLKSELSCNSGSGASLGRFCSQFNEILNELKNSSEKNHTESNPDIKKPLNRAINLMKGISTKLKNLDERRRRVIQQLEKCIENGFKSYAPPENSITN